MKSLLFKMADISKKRLRKATIIYWVLLFYIIAALIWWLLSLEQQNSQIFELKKQALQQKFSGQANSLYQQELKRLVAQKRRVSTKYISEGITFLLLIIVGAAYIYRMVRKQFILQQQQQNFVMAVTHELKTPIAVSRLNLETLQKHKLDEIKKGKLLQTTLQETLRLDTLINNILISSQLEGDSYKMIKEELNFSDLAADAGREFSSRYPDRQLKANIEPEIEMVGDAFLLKLFISNLLENANKYSSKEKPIVLKLLQLNNGIELSIIDEGLGIAGEEKEAVFKKFYRVGDEHTRKTQGTGLGLYLCKKIAKDHKGKIWIEDNRPAGSNFITRFIV